MFYKLIRQSLGFLVETVKTAAVMILVAFAIKAFLIQTFVIEGSSMEPNFHNSEFLLIDKISYRFSNPKRGEIIVFRPAAAADNYIKRIVGMPGETIKIVNNEIFIDDRRLDEPYLSQGALTKMPTNKIFRISDDEYFVLGDNRENSKDSRAIGPINKKQIEGRVFLIFYPISTMRLT